MVPEDLDVCYSGFILFSVNETPRQRSRALRPIELYFDP